MTSRRALAPMLFQDHDKVGAEAARTSVVAPAQRSAAAVRKVARKRTDDNTPLHSFQSLLKDLATLTKNRVRAPLAQTPPFEMLAKPTPLQEKAFSLLNIMPKL